MSFKMEALMLKKNPLLFTLMLLIIAISGTFYLYNSSHKSISTGNNESINYSSEDEKNFAIAIYWEAKNENETGKIAVAHVILNRVEHKEFPNSITGVVSQGGRKRPCQFDYYCNSKPDTPTEKDNWEVSQKIAKEVLQGMHRDPTNGALFFHTVRIKNPFSKKRQFLKKIGNNMFYK